jgi:hypothetical protein
MTFLEAQRAARRGGPRLVDAGHTPNGLYRMLEHSVGGEVLKRAATRGPSVNEPLRCHLVPFSPQGWICVRTMPITCTPC